MSQWDPPVQGQSISPWGRIEVVRGTRDPGQIPIPTQAFSTSSSLLSVPEMRAFGILHKHRPQSHQSGGSLQCLASFRLICLPHPPSPKPRGAQCYCPSFTPESSIEVCKPPNILCHSYKHLKTLCQNFSLFLAWMLHTYSHNNLVSILSTPPYIPQSLSQVP